MLSGQYRTHAGTLVEPPMSQEFVLERIHKAAAAIFYEAVRQRLWLRGPGERKNTEMLLSYLSIAEEADNVQYKVMTDETKALMNPPPAVRHITLSTRTCGSLLRSRGSTLRSTE